MTRWCNIRIGCTRRRFELRVPWACALIAAIGLVLTSVNSQSVQGQRLSPSTTRQQAIESDTEYDTGKRIANVEKDSVRESSGLAVSRKFAQRFWTHNDSGDEARLFCFDKQGKHLGTSHVKKVKSKDWEDMASATIDGESYLIIGDIGDNLRKRKSCKVLIVPEPSNPKKDVRIWKSTKFTYEGGPVDCEALAYDPVQRQFLLVEKRLSLTARVYALPLSSAVADANENRTIVAKQIAIIPVSWVTAADISHDGQQLIVGTYQPSFLFKRQDNEPWSVALRRNPVSIKSPIRKQGETICFGTDGETLYFTSEKRPTPLFEIRKRAKNK